MVKLVLCLALFVAGAIGQDISQVEDVLNDSFNKIEDEIVIPDTDDNEISPLNGIFKFVVMKTHH